jgi:hypothetical protein
MYTITIKVDEKKRLVHIHAEMETRKARAGEFWMRGNDLFDGEYSQESWHRIRSAIVATEVVKLVKSKKNKEMTSKKQFEEIYHMPDSIDHEGFKLSEQMGHRAYIEFEQSEEHLADLAKIKAVEKKLYGG